MSDPRHWPGQWANYFSARRDAMKLLATAGMLNAILMGFFLAVFTPCYETNDDLNMQWIASGIYGGHPSTHLVFTHVWIGWLIRSLYGLGMGWNWYYIYLLAVHFLSLTAIAFLILRRSSHWAAVLLFAGFFLFVESRILLKLQFTTTAFIAGTAAVFLMADGLRPGRAPRWTTAAAGFAFFALAGMIRESVAPLVAIIAFPFLLERFGLKGWRRLLLMGVVCAGLFAGLSVINRWTYRRDPGWGEFLDYNRANGWIRVTPMKQFIPQAASAVGWSENDAWIFSRWYFFDPEVFGSVSQMRRLMEELQKIPRPRPYAGRYAMFCFHLPQLLGGEAGELLRLTALSAAGCALFSGVRRKRYIVAMAGLYAIFAMLTFRLLDGAYLPQRVAYTMPLFFHAVCLYWASGFPGLKMETGTTARPTGGAGNRNFARGLFLAMALLWGGLYGARLYSWSKNLLVLNDSAVYMKYEVSPKIFDPLRKLLPPGQKPVIVPVSFYIPSPLEDSLFFHSGEELPFTLLPYGWLVQSPLFKQCLEDHALKPYSTSLADRPDVFFSMGADWVEPLQTFYREHYGWNVRFELVLDTSQTQKYADCLLNLYQARRDASTPNTTNRTSLPAAATH